MECNGFDAMNKAVISTKEYEELISYKVKYQLLRKKIDRTINQARYSFITEKLSMDSYELSDLLQSLNPEEYDKKIGQEIQKMNEQKEKEKKELEKLKEQGEDVPF